MSAALALAAAQAAGIRISVDGSDLVLDADAPPPADVLAGLKEHKAEIIALLKVSPEAAAISPAAVRAAYEAIVARLIADHGRPPDAARAGALDHLRIELRRDPRLLRIHPVRTAVRLAWFCVAGSIAVRRRRWRA